MKQEIDTIVEGLLEKPYWVVDLLPYQVPENSRGQFFAVERYYLEEPRHGRLCRQFADVLLKLNCYRDIELDGEKNPEPVRIAEAVRERTAYIMTGGAMILSEPDDTHMTVFNPDGELLGLLRELAPAEGLFLWKPAACGETAD